MIRITPHPPNAAIIVLAASVFISATGSAGTVYDNSQGSLNRVFHVPATGPGTRIQVGDQIFLDGTDRRVTSFEFEAFVGLGTGGTATFGNETAEVLFYANNGGPSGLAPGALIFRSGEFNLNAGFQTVALQGLSVPVPDSFTWAVAFGGIELGEHVGLLHYNPPMVGASFDDLWVKDSGIGWSTLVIDNGATSGNFGARITATADPSALVFTAHTPSGDRTWSVALGSAGQSIQINQSNANGTTTTILSSAMLPQGKFLQPIIDFGFENDMIWLVHHERNASGAWFKSISVFDPDDPVGTFTSVVTVPANGPTPVTEVTPGQDPARGAGGGLIVVRAGAIRGGPVPTQDPAPVDPSGIIPGEDPRRTPAGGVSVPDDLNDLITIPGDFRRPPPSVPPTPVTEITRGEDPRRTEAGGAGFPGVIISFPTAPTMAPPPSPITIITPGRDPNRSSEIGSKQEIRKSHTTFRMRKLR